MAELKRQFESVRKKARELARPVRAQVENIVRPVQQRTDSGRALVSRRALLDRRASLLDSPTFRILAAAGAGYAIYKTVQALRAESLRGQVVLITGASRGLGFLLAREFAREGCRVAICARDEQKLADACLELRRLGANVEAFRCDVSDRRQVLNLVSAVAAHFGRIDVLVNNAGEMHVMPLQAATEADFERAMDVMFWGTLYPALAVARHMRPHRSGRIVNITSIGGFVSVPHLLPYTCAKFAAVGLSQGLRAELARDGISVTTIVPGLMRIGSPLNAWFRGNQKAEYAWFSAAASLPLMTMNAERAARQIVAATKRRQALRILGLPANILERLHGLFPGTVANIMSLVNQALPALTSAAARTDVRGIELEPQLRSRLHAVITRPSWAAAGQTRQFAEQRVGE